ncbi:MAG: selenocysteine-specific translation elongation factor [Acidimicrobiia bacterium]|nr:selenocysteine-specific translation elongation factor [Acidimicrobiia bacterium]
MPIIATAGHVDHGKSTLVEALTGRDPDRWAEEKERGLTIDLGFAWTKVGGTEVGFVDVPGHERFIKNMLAGVGAVDVALFVVAADEGWMPQSEEHLAVLDLMGTRRGVVALTRIDRADAETADISELSILEAIEGTHLRDWPIVRVSPVTGEGMPALVQNLEDQLAAAGPTLDCARPRLWVDRSFRIAGVGLVVTGTLTGGWIAVDDQLMLWPGEHRVRVRGLQSHDDAATELGPGTRAALNITGIEDTNRGSMLGKADTFRTTTRLLARVRTVRHLEAALPGRGAYHLHAGTGAWPVELRILTADKREAAVLVRSRGEIPLHAGDRFILRETGRQAVVAGGMVLDPHPPRGGAGLRAAAELLDRVPIATANDAADALLEIRGRALLTELASDSGGGQPSSSFRAGNEVMAEGAAQELHGQLVGVVSRFHAENRLRPGIPKATLSSVLGVDPAVIRVVTASSEAVSDDGATIRLVGFSPGLSPSEQESWDSARAKLAEGLAVPRASQLGIEAELLHALLRAEELQKVGDDLVYLPEQLTEIESRLSQLPDEFTVAEFRDLMGVTRRQAVPLLEWLDSRGVTVRRGDIRVVS